LLTGDSADPRVLAFEPDGSLASSFDVAVTEVHGLSVATVEAIEMVWIADNGRKRRPEQNYAMQQAPGGGQVVAVDLQGQVLSRLAKPALGVYEENLYAPTASAVDKDTGDMWVADGYGQSLVHKYDRSGRYVDSLTGDEPGAAGRFNAPHSVFIDQRKRDPELYVTDRGNRRIQVYDLAGNFKRSFGGEYMTGPCCLAVDEDRLLVAEYIDARVTVLDIDDRLIGYLGENRGANDEEGWPNSTLPDGTIVRNRHLIPGRFVRLTASRWIGQETSS
jgi:DNA-binding beta-propeller fold protein YncE